MADLKIKNQNKTVATPVKPASEPAPVPPRSVPQDWLQSLESMLEITLKNQGPDKANLIVSGLLSRLRAAGLQTPSPVSTPYINTIAPQDEPPYPGNREIERRIKSLARWNAMAMVVNANHNDTGVGGHISSYASMATLYEVAYNHFFRGGEGGRQADLIYFQGHTTPGNYARAFL
jgi:pyruvate dehydrogenase E1 component